jgi:endonuclease/exonuclease/phosphatase family metal-dependent hydrolase
MTVRLATFNMENLFSRPLVMNQATWAAGKPALAAFAKLLQILEKDDYSAGDKQQIKKTLEDYGPAAAKDRRFISVEQVRGTLYTTSGGKVTVKATGRSAWVGWAELVRTDLKWPETENTGRVVEAMAPDVLLAVEVEDRPMLQRFNDQVLTPMNVAFPYNALVDGNDERGIDIGIFSRHPIRSVRPHMFDTDSVGVVFSRDCPEFEIELPGGESLWILGNHWKSKGYGAPASTTAKRLRQARRVEQIYQSALARDGAGFAVVMGDLNDTPDSTPVQVLTAAGLQDVMSHPSYNGTPGTFGTGNTVNQKIDYIFLPTELWGRVLGVGVERRGVYAPSLAPTIGPLFATSHLDQASDHAAVWVDLDL